MQFPLLLRAQVPLSQFFTPHSCVIPKIAEYTHLNYPRDILYAEISCGTKVDFKGHCFGKKEKYALGEFVYQISGLCRFLFDQGV